MDDPRLIPHPGRRTEMNRLTEILDYLEVHGADRVWGQVEQTAGGCWNHHTRPNRSGYCNVTLTIPGVVKNKTVSAHKVAYFLDTGEWLSANLDVCHECDNPRCVNPAHLWAGTTSENQRDAAKKGRTASGSRSGVAVFSREYVHLIRAAFDRGISRAEIARTFGLDWTTVDKCVRRITYCGDEYEWRRGRSGSLRGFADNAFAVNERDVWRAGSHGGLAGRMRRYDPFRRA